MKDDVFIAADPYDDSGVPTQSGLRPPPFPRERRAAQLLRVFVCQPRAAKRPFMERLLRLDTWGDTLLVGKVADEMSTAYLILVIVFLFEMLAWSLLFNFVFYGGKFDAGWLTLPAVLLGLLWALGTFAIDKGLITTDLTQRGFAKWIGFIGRVALIVVSVVFTAQPIEQLFFRSMVDERLKEETLRTQAAALKVGFDDERHKRQDLGSRRVEDGIPADFNAERKAAEHDKDDADIALRQLDGQVREQEARLQRATGALGARRNRAKRLRQLDDPEAVEAELAAQQQQVLVHSLSAALELTLRKRSEAAAVAQTAEEHRRRSQASFDKQLDRVDANRRDETQQSDDKLERYRGVLARFRDARFGDPVQSFQGHRAGWNEDGFVERTLVLSQLRDGLAARWPAGITPAKREEIAAWAGLPELDSQAARPDEGHSVFVPWLFLMLLAGAIPMLSIAFKLTMSEELKTYYSLEAQARAGNAGAVAHRQVRAREYVS